MQNFTPVSALIGGSLIGSSAVLLLWLNGRIAGISGIFHGLYPYQRKDFLWRLLFLAGLIIGSQIYYLLPQIHFIPRTNYSVNLLFLAGLLVGIGTKLSGGCTSGHGVCGIARMSIRSFTATGIFFIFGLGTVFFMRHIWGIS
ncbi:MAG: YeeE/YedE thiosulfate transporter family protein [Gammaproteobacteria bacterium]|nr:YeeE/YedE thiosulfate transporter family protein [Gammaproteobacteria bacterium]